MIRLNVPLSVIFEKVITCFLKKYSTKFTLTHVFAANNLEKTKMVYIL